MHTADGDRRLVAADPEVIARVTIVLWVLLPLLIGICRITRRDLAS